MTERDYDAEHERVLQAGMAYVAALRAFGESLLYTASERHRYERAEDYSEHIAALRMLGDALNEAIDAAYGGPARPAAPLPSAGGER